MYRLRLDRVLLLLLFCIYYLVIRINPVAVNGGSAALCLRARSLFSTSSLTHLVLFYWLQPHSLSVANHFHSATTDLNTDLALSVPLRPEREIPPPPPPPPLSSHYAVGLNFACLISLLAARVRLVISFRFLHILLFSRSEPRLENIALGSKRWRALAYRPELSIQIRFIR